MHPTSDDGALVVEPFGNRAGKVVYTQPVLQEFGLFDPEAKA